MRPLISRILPLAALGILVLALPAAAQNSGAVVGQVLDQDGNPYGFVDVFLESVGGSYQGVELADDEGKFAFRPVPTGDYKLYAYAAGFQSTLYEGVSVTPNRTLTYTLTLQPADSLVETVTIDARLLDMVDTKKTDNSMTLEGEFIEAIPLQNKRIQDIVALFAGVTRNGSSDSSDISVAGGNSSQIGYRLNGISINDPVSGGAILDISTGAIQDFKLITGGFQAEYGEQSTGIAEIVTKSGTNDVSWAYEISYRNSDVGAAKLDELADLQVFWNSLLSGEGTLLAGELRSGFALMGVDPISTLEDDHNPTPRQRVRHTISTGGPVVRDKVFLHVTAEALEDDFGSAFADGTNNNDQILFNSKVDWKVSDNNKLVVTADIDTSTDTGFASFTNDTTTDRDFIAGTYQFSAVNTHVFNANNILELRLSSVRNYAAGRPKDPRAGVGTVYNVPLPPGGFVQYGLGDAFADSDQTIVSSRLGTTWTRVLGDDGQHEVKVGGDIQLTQADLFVEQGAQVTDLRVTDDRSVFSTPTIIGRELTRGDPIRTSDSAVSMSFFLQDRWRLTDNLTFDVGVRGDYQDFVGRLFLSPRVGFSLDPIGDGKTRFFGNWGIFYDNLFTSALQHEANPDRLFADIYNANPVSNELKFGDTTIKEIYKEALSTPVFTQDPEAVAFLLPTIQDRYVLDEDLTAPTNKSWSLGLERRLPANMRLQLSYQEARRTNQLTTFARTVREPQFLGERTIREVVLTNGGRGNYRQWTVELQRPFSKGWNANISYTQAKNQGPLAPPANPIDPFDVVTENGTLGNDRTHVVKLQGLAKLPWKVDLSTDFTWQTGTPISAQIITSSGQAIRPFGRNTLRLPSSRQLNFGLKRAFQTADGKITMGAELKFFNLLNEFNVFAGLGRFEVPEGVADPQAFPPLRPTVIPTGIDVSRSMEMGFRISF
jgi:hypothetical protein